MIFDTLSRILYILTPNEIYREYSFHGKFISRFSLHRRFPLIRSTTSFIAVVLGTAAVLNSKCSA